MTPGTKKSRMAAGTTMRGRFRQGENNENAVIIAYIGFKNQGGAANDSG